jgi:hypothetical protein
MIRDKDEEDDGVTREADPPSLLMEIQSSEMTFLMMRRSSRGRK